MASTLGIVSVACACAAGGVALRWWPRRRDSLGRERSFPVYSVGVLALLAVLAAIPGVHRRVEERRLAQVAGDLSGRAVTVHCQTTTGELIDAGSELGFVPFGQDGVSRPVIYLKHQQCALLRRYLGGHRAAPSLDEVIAVHVLTHEAMHVRGETSEAVAECRAMQRDVASARALGASAEQAARLALVYRVQVYPRMPADYVTPDCRAEGPLDEHLEPSVFAP